MRVSPLYTWYNQGIEKFSDFPSSQSGDEPSCPFPSSRLQLPDDSMDSTVFHDYSVFLLHKLKLKQHLPSPISS